LPANHSTTVAIHVRGRHLAYRARRESARQTLQRSLLMLEPALGKLDPLTLATRASLENMLAAPADTR
jgi:hypothetical protein